MMSALIRYFVNHKLLMWLTITALVIGNLLSIFSLQRENFPKVEFHQARIKTIFPGASPVDVEQRVTIPIEEELREIEGLKKVRSISRQSMSEITVQVDLSESNPGEILEEVRRAIERVSDLPPEVIDPPLFSEIKSGTIPVIEISLYGASNIVELNDAAQFYETQLERLPGVARVIVFGEREREWQILVKPNNLKRYNLSLLDVNRALSGQNVNIPGGVLESKKALNLRTTGEFNSIEELGALPVRSNEDGGVVRLKELASFKDTYSRPRLLSRTNGEPAINIQILKKSRADILTLVDSVKGKLKELEGKTPVKTNIANDFSLQTRRQLNVVTNNAVIGLFLVVAILVIFLSSRMAVLTALSLPLVLGSALMLFPYNDISFNMISMMGIIIALGMLVDNSIVIAENVFRHRESGLSPLDAAIRGSSDLTRPIIGSYLTTAAAFLPMMFMSGIMGKFIWQIPFVVILTLTISLLESFFLLPARMAYYGGNPGRHDATNPVRGKLNQMFDALTDAFTTVISKVTARPTITLMLIAVVLAGSFFTLSRMKFTLFPREEVEQLLIKAEFEPSLRVVQTINRMAVIEKLILDLPEDELVSYSLKAGVQQQNPNDPLQRHGEHLAMLHVFLTPEVTRKRSAMAIIEELKPKLTNIPDLVDLSIEELVPAPPIGAAVTVAVEGPEYQTLQEISAKLKEHLRQTSGVYNVSDDYKMGREELVVRLNQTKAALAGISTERAALLVRTAFEGSEVSVMRKGMDEITLRVIYDAPYRSKAELIQTLSVPNRVGLQTPLGAISTTNRVSVPESLSHYNFERAITITAHVRENIITSVEANQAVFEHFKEISEHYPGYQLSLRGEQENTKESMESLARAGSFAIFAIFAILAMVFNDIRKPLLILSSIPLGIVGIVIGFQLSGKAMSFLALIGIIGLAGVQVNASIMLVTFIQELLDEGVPPLQAIISAAKTRFRPILLTTLTTMGGLFPTAYSFGGSDPVLIPITLALAWGLGFGTFGSLLYVPAVYSFFYKWRSRSSS